MENTNLIRFVPEGCENDVVKQKKQVNKESLTGEEAKSFYEDLIKDDIESEQTRKRNRKGKRNSKEKSKDGMKINLKKKHTITLCDTYNALEQRKVTKEIVEIKQELDEPSFGIDSFDSGVERLYEKRKVNHSEVNKSIQMHMLKCAQNGDLPGLKKLFKNEKDLDVDFQDGYGWTALMCAAVSRHIEVIKFLISVGANKYILNNEEKTVLEICEEVGAIDAKIVINTFTGRSDEKPAVNKNVTFFCDVCKSEFRECTKIKHETSTVHLFSLRLKPKPDQFSIPESNRGFQLMRKSGWDGCKGLGPEGQGTKYPVKTTLKRDRLCLGSEVKEKAKVTHFGPKDLEAVKTVHKHSQRVMSARTVAKRERIRREKRDKQWERNLRTYMNIDSPYL
ncbi:G patch domain and ankyrin repeat-containing protein 1 homolog [Ruditapes philippinarum]|uniref:G patch domain and ankyrin repeat-containing protein 1 homolog n=1 Tax=Ruditapes philippinarum TaxID=129788 RepID=UPI00295BB0CA|nr:G patch domain and ankyrin repeat-containing protein 1 homolog [Ruditapes philippinarum]XP_060565717.1 G patch domain and ankyrin repeat-containing protein 1 homolog [Ruditapes philippinarum]